MSPTNFFFWLSGLKDSLFLVQENNTTKYLSKVFNRIKYTTEDITPEQALNFAYMINGYFELPTSDPIAVLIGNHLKLVFKNVSVQNTKPMKEPITTLGELMKEYEEGQKKKCKKNTQGYPAKNPYTDIWNQPPNTASIAIC